MQLAELVVRVTAGVRVSPTLLVALFGLVQVNAPFAYAVWGLAGDCSLVQQCPCKLAIGALVAQSMFLFVPFRLKIGVARRVYFLVSIFISDPRGVIKFRLHRLGGLLKDSASLLASFRCLSIVLILVT